MIRKPTFESVYRDELQNLYDAERQIINALPDISSAAYSADLKAAFTDHLQDTREQLARLERILTELGEEPGTKASDGMRGLLSEARLLFNDLSSSPILDMALIGAAQKVEHYEIAGYEVARNLAATLGREKESRILQKTLDEEKDTTSQLSDIAEGVLAGDDLEEPEDEGQQVA